MTNEYNQAVKRILPQKGINVIEIPRKENDNGIISASLVRRYLEDDNRTDLKELIPKSTWEILFGYRIFKENLEYKPPERLTDSILTLSEAARRVSIAEGDYASRLVSMVYKCARRPL